MKENRKVLLCLACLLASLLVFSLQGKTVMATSMIHLVELHAGAEEVLDVVDELQLDALIIPSETGTQEEKEEEQSDLVMANVKESMNVREEPDADSKKVGLLYADCGGTILERSNGWTKLQSGNLIGWAKDDYLLFGKEAQEMAESVGTYKATVTADALRVRKEATQESGVWGLVKKGDVYEALTDQPVDEWIPIEYAGEEGYISAEYVTLAFDIDSGETLDEIKAREKREREERAKLIANQGAVAVGTTDDVLLAALIQCEAANQPYEGQLAVGAVVMNRVRSGGYPNTIAGVIYASGQFSPAVSGGVEARVKKGVKDSCLQAARAAINGETTVGGACHFRRVGYHEGVEIGGHVFW